MAILSDYLKKDGVPSAARLCSVWGLLGSIVCSFAAVIAWIFAANTPNWALAAICAVPGAVGTFPLVFQYIRGATDSGKLETIIKAIKDK